MKRIKGLVYDRERIDRFFRSRGFVCGNKTPPVYELRIRDHISGQEYCLRIPTQENNDYLRLCKPVIDRKNSGPDQREHQSIPGHIKEAADHKLAEIFSYLDSEAPSPNKN
ncbi:hypothetical protein C8P63_101268 [Melghirimyces profundicolus]|uniref:Uncharacterized protein n=1 Tax=Melghirimyces profundicolus TaxID=1242148 RepID=A0A2T6C9P4_9BACL|nr:hypothetical protein [Melghirimyces profundicolus]PTX65044.1 hypothetical protein C8P63_101268 [Melghirimyces profundicolus]